MFSFFILILVFNIIQLYLQNNIIMFNSDKVQTPKPQIVNPVNNKCPNGYKYYSNECKTKICTLQRRNPYCKLNK
jgi:hypothetical protein